MDNTITQEIFEQDPTLAKRGFQVGDLIPASEKEMPPVRSNVVAPTPPADPVDPEKEALRKQVEEMTKALAGLPDLMKTVEQLTKAVDKGRFEHEQNKDKKVINPIVMLTTFDGKIVKEWKQMKTNTMEKNPDGSYTEELECTVVFADGSTQDMPYIDFAVNKPQKVPAIIKSRTLTTDDDGEERTVFKVEAEGVGILEIDSRFVN